MLHTLRPYLPFGVSLAKTSLTLGRLGCRVGWRVEKLETCEAGKGRCCSVTTTPLAKPIQRRQPLAIVMANAAVSEEKAQRLAILCGECDR